MVKIHYKTSGYFFKQGITMLSTWARTSFVTYDTHYSGKSLNKLRQHFHQ